MFGIPGGFFAALPINNGTKALLADHSELLAYHHLVLAIAILTLALVALGGGKGLGVMLKPLINKILGKPPKEVTVNVGTSPPPPDGPKCVLVDPTRCPDHKAEHERSIRNEKGISLIQIDLKSTRGQLFEKMEINKTEIFTKLNGLEEMMSEVRVAVAKLVVESDFQSKKRR